MILEQQVCHPCPLAPVDRLLVGCRLQILYTFRFARFTVQQQQVVSFGGPSSIDAVQVWLLRLLVPIRPQLAAAATIRVEMVLVGQMMMVVVVVVIMLMLLLLLLMVVIVVRNTTAAADAAATAATSAAGSATTGGTRGRRGPGDAQFEVGVYGGLYWGITSKRSGA